MPTVTVSSQSQCVSSLVFSPVVPVVDLSLGTSTSSDFDLPILLIGSLSGVSSTPTTSSTSSMSSLKKMFNTLLEAKKPNSQKKNAREKNVLFFKLRVASRKWSDYFILQ